MTRPAKGTAAAPGRNVRGKAGLNREILASGWGCWSEAGTESSRPGGEGQSAFTSQQCSACGFVCQADVNVARNIAAGYVVPVRGGDR